MFKHLNYSNRIYTYLLKIESLKEKNEMKLENVYIFKDNMWYNPVAWKTIKKS